MVLGTFEKLLCPNGRAVTAARQGCFSAGVTFCSPMVAGTFWLPACQRRETARISSPFPGNFHFSRVVGAALLLFLLLWVSWAILGCRVHLLLRLQIRCRTEQTLALKTWAHLLSTLCAATKRSVDSCWRWLILIVGIQAFSVHQIHHQLCCRFSRGRPFIRLVVNVYRDLCCWTLHY